MVHTRGGQLRLAANGIYSLNLVEKEFSEVRSSNLPHPSRGVRALGCGRVGFCLQAVDMLIAFVASNRSKRLRLDTVGLPENFGHRPPSKVEARGNRTVEPHALTSAVPIIVICSAPNRLSRLHEPRWFVSTARRCQRPTGDTKRGAGVLPPPLCVRVDGCFFALAVPKNNLYLLIPADGAASVDASFGPVGAGAGQDGPVRGARHDLVAYAEVAGAQTGLRPHDGGSMGGPTAQ
jgi:hypothetical protein